MIKPLSYSDLIFFTGKNTCSLQKHPLKISIIKCKSSNKTIVIKPFNLDILIPINYLQGDFYKNGATYAGVISGQQIVQKLVYRFLIVLKKLTT